MQAKKQILSNITPLHAYIDAANIITCLNINIGVFSILYSFLHKITLASIMIVAAAAIDHLDGWVARRYGSANKAARQFGGHLDTLADELNFCVSPAAALLAVTGAETGAIVAAAAFIVAGLCRLAHFEIVGAVGGRIYSGLPTTYAGYVTAYVLTLLDGGAIGNEIAVTLFILLAFLEISKIKVKKPSYFITVGVLPFSFAVFCFLFISMTP